jgi:hypothetical protein
MRMAGRFSRRVRAYAKAHPIPVKDCAPGEKKHKIGEQHLMGEQHLAGGDVKPGLFLILVARAPALVWDVKKTGEGKIGIIEAKGHQPNGKARWPFVNLLLSYLGRGVETHHDQDERAPTVWRPSDVERP